MLIDLKDAYLHFPIHPSHLRFLAFRYKEVDYCFRALPFGLSMAPRVFYKGNQGHPSFPQSMRHSGVRLS